MPLLLSEPPIRSRNNLAEPLVELLDQLHCVVVSLSDTQYAQHPIGPIGSSIGAHMRHCLDHIAAFVSYIRLEKSLLDYDHRERGTPIETDRQAALLRISELQDELLDVVLDAREQVRLRMLIAPDRPAIETTSTVGRELSFVLSHTIHHNALMLVMLKMMGVHAPSGLGLAPATAQFRSEHRC